jgi:hypothetical protein
MSEHTHLRRPPNDCPNDGVCSSILPRLEECEDSNKEHSELLTKIGSEVHDIKVTLRERDRTHDFLRTVFLTLLGCFAGGALAMVVQVVVTVHYFGGMTEKLERVVRAVDDHEHRLREHSKYINRQSP